jgi:predicted small secreted protein
MTTRAKLSLVLCVSSLLAACANTTPVQPVGRDRFMVSSTVRGGFTTDGQIKSDLLDRARAFCGKKEMVLESSSSGGTQGWTPQTAEVLFKCE